LEAEAAGDGGAAVLEVVEAGGDAGGVEGMVGVEGRVCVREGEPVGVRAEQPVVDLARPLGHACELAAAEQRHLGMHAELAAGRPVGHPGADEAFDGAPRAPAACERWAQAELAQVDDGWFALAPQDGHAPKDQQCRRADDPGPDLFEEVGVIEREAEPPHLGVGVGHRGSIRIRPARAYHRSPFVAVAGVSYAGGR
jgi:hypothetical protein